MAGKMNLGKDEESPTILRKLTVHMLLFYALYYAAAAAIAAAFPGHSFTGKEPFSWDVDPTGTDAQKVGTGICVV